MPLATIPVTIATGAGICAGMWWITEPGATVMFTIVFGRSGSTFTRSHWPMHGPHALASTTPPIASRSASSPSRSIVARTCSEPGVMYSGTLARRPAPDAWRAMLAARLMSS